MTTEELKILDEIMDFIDKENIYLYLIVRDYALKNKPEWLILFRKKTIRQHIIAYTNSKRRVDKVKKNCFYEYLDSKYQNLES